MGVDHAGHDDSPPGVDLESIGRRRHVDPDLADHSVDDEDVAIGENPMRIVHREDDAVSEHDRSAVFEGLPGRADGLVHFPPLVKCCGLVRSVAPCSVLSTITLHPTGMGTEVLAPPVSPDDRDSPSHR